MTFFVTAFFRIEWIESLFIGAIQTKWKTSFITMKNSVNILSMAVNHKKCDGGKTDLIDKGLSHNNIDLSLIHISEPTRREWLSRMPSSA